MTLGLDFILSSLIWFSVVGVFVFAFRKHLKKLFFGATSYDLFLNKIKTYLTQNYPGFKPDFSIVEDSKDEPNPVTRKYLITDNIVEQFLNIKIDPSKYPKSTPQNLQWGTYVVNSEPNRDKLPPDWVQRKNALIQRENKTCLRCSKHIDINTIQIHMIRPLEKGGKYFLENLLGVCKDCEKILSQNPKKMKFFDIKDDLHRIVKETA